MYIYLFIQLVRRIRLLVQHNNNRFKKKKIYFTDKQKINDIL